MSDQERIDQLEERAARLETRLADHEARVLRVETRLKQVEAQHQQLMTLLGLTGDGAGMPTTLHGLLETLAKARLN